jgi:L-histidine N-alpha-methyltransferase
VLADFEHHLGDLPVGGRRLVAFLGGTVGNLLPAGRNGFLASLHEVLAPGDSLLLGTDLVKSPDVLIPAYDDAAGVTAEFNRNVLRVLNRELDADLNPDAFDHVAIWDASNEWIEMRLRTRSTQRITLRALELVIELEAGEEIRTEVSAKFRQAGLEAELKAADFTPAAWWTDEAGRYAVSLATV